MKRVLLLLGQVIALTVIKVTADPDVLETTIITQHNELIHLRWVETETLLANQHLPVWLTTTEPGFLERDVNVMRQLGKFKTYHDLTKSSAIVLFEKWDCIYGIIDVRYVIDCLPLDELRGQQHIIGENEYIRILLDEEWPNHDKPLDLSRASPTNYIATFYHQTQLNFKMLIKTFVNRQSYSSDNTVLPPTSREYEPSSKRLCDGDYTLEEQVITVYPEILIFISNEIARAAKDLTTLVLRYIVQFNAVSMLFNKLTTHGIKININMAGLVIERNFEDFPSTLLFEMDHPSGSAVLNVMTEYIKSLKFDENGSMRKFSQDSFDMFTLTTKNKWREHAMDRSGISTDVYHLLEYRKTCTRRSHMKFLGSIVDGTNNMQYYVNAAREIAHLMRVQDDPINVDLCLNGEQCHAIMQTGGKHCGNCLTWCYNSLLDFKRYLSMNTNRCFLRNLPRSLHPFGHPIRTLIPADQCLCYTFLPGSATTHLRTNDHCDKILRCVTTGKALGTALPVDGTPCDKNDNNKVCWRKECVSTQLGG